MSFRSMGRYVPTTSYRPAPTASGRPTTTTAYVPAPTSSGRPTSTTQAPTASESGQDQEFLSEQAKQKQKQLTQKEFTLWCMSWPQDCYDYSPGEPELVTGRPYVEGDELTQASSSESTEADSKKKTQYVVVGIAVLAVGGTLVYLFTKKKRRR